VIRHLLKLVWHRKGANALVTAEIFCSFLIVFAVVTMGVSMLSRWNAPLGFSWKNVWVVQIDEINSPVPRELSGSHTSTSPEAAGEELGARVMMISVEQLLRELRAMPQIEGAAADAMTPFAESTWGTRFDVDGRHVDVTADQATDDYARVMKLNVLKGRWFRPDDDAQNYLPIVLDSDAAQALFKTTDAVGLKLPAAGFRAANNAPAELRVVGVIAPYRKDGEFSSPDLRMTFFRASFLHPQSPATRHIVIAVRPGTPAEFEAQLNNRLHAIAPDVTFRLRRMDQMRNLALRIRLAPLAVLATVALFLISMVGLGLTGVLWQTVTRRMREIGLRRALGATGRAVRTQVLVEVALLATLAVVVAVIIVLQLPLLGAFRVVTPREFSIGFAGALAVIYAITLLCGLYPSWLASRVEPAEALRYE
jgi:putative ABC transport system permease protein